MIATLATALTMLGIGMGLFVQCLLRNGHRPGLIGPRWAMGAITLALLLLGLTDVSGELGWIVAQPVRRLLNRGLLCAAITGFAGYLVWPQARKR